MCERVSATGRAAGDFQVIAWGLHGQAFNLMALGDLELAEKFLLEATALLKAVPDYYVLQYTLGDLAMCYTLQGKLDEASLALHEADSVIEKYALKGLVLSFVRNTKVETSLMMAERLEENERKMALRRIKKSCKTALRVNRRFKTGEARSCRLMGTFCWLKGKESLAKSWWKKGLRIAEAQGAKYEEGLIYYEKGKRMKNSDSLKKAQVIFEQLHASLDVERVKLECAHLDLRP
jgi:tetratricopeptide (TPR) repeat protein